MHNHANEMMAGDDGSLDRLQMSQESVLYGSSPHSEIIAQWISYQILGNDNDDHTANYVTPCIYPPPVEPTLFISVTLVDSYGSETTPLSPAKRKALIAF